jgi:hypothetical protein
MLFASHAGGHENTEMADGLMNSIDNRLSIGPDFVDVLVEVENPAERLSRGGYVVTL